MNVNAILALIAGLIPVINNAVAFINKTAETLRQSKEMTPEQEAALDAHIASIDTPDHWKTDAEKAQGTKTTGA